MAGYERHRVLGTPTCDECRAANAAYRRAWRAAHRTPEVLAQRARYMAARGRALTRLAKAYPAQFRDYLDEELMRNDG